MKSRFGRGARMAERRPAPLVLLACVLALSATSELSAQDRGRERFDVAIGLLQRELWDEAAKKFARFLRDHPRHELVPEARYRLGTCEEKLSNKERAIEAYLSALQSRGLRFRAECRYRAGKLLQGGKRFADAAQQFSRLLDEVEADHYLALPTTYALGEAQRDAGKKSDALRSFLRAAQLEKDKKGAYGMPALYHAGFMQSALGREVEAAKLFEAAAQRFPGHEAACECLYLAGEASFRAKDWERAARDYRKSLAAGDAFAAQARYGLAWCRLRQKRDAEAAAAFAEVQGRHAKSKLAAKAGLERGAILQRIGKSENAIPVLRALLRARGAMTGAARVRALEVLGLAQLDVEKAEDAAQSFRLALREELDDPSKARIAYDLGEALSETGDPKPAAQAYDMAAGAALRAKDTDLRGDALYGAAVAFHESGDFGACVDRATRLLKDHPEHRLGNEAVFARAEGLFAQSKWQAAAASYEQVSTKHELSGQARFKHAWCAYLDKRAELAAQRFEAIADRKGDFGEEALSLATLARFQAGQKDRALADADRYLVRHKNGAFLARTERVAAQVLAERGDLDAAASRIARAAGAEKDQGKASADRLQVGELLFRRGDFESAKAR